MLKDFVPRLYQETILATAAKKNTLVVLPTGMGKTALSLLLAIHRFKLFPNSKALILAPTKPLAQQHLETFKKHLEIPEEQLVLLTGAISPEKRSQLWQTARIAFSTPQGLENDIISERIKLDDISLLVFDEAHRAVGDYAYVFIAKQYATKAKYPRILALTASPGSDIEKIKEVMQNLYIEAIEIRTRDDPDVKPYIKETKIEWIKVELQEELKRIQQILKDFLKLKTRELEKYSIKNLQFATKKDLLKLQAQLHAKLSQGNRSFSILKAVSILAQIIKIQHALELLETQGIKPLWLYLKGIQEQATTTKVKAVKNLVEDLHFKTALVQTQALYERDIRHPKLTELLRTINRELYQKKDIKIIIFTQYRDSASEILEELKKMNINARIFVGQAKKGTTGMSQKEQKEILDKFRQGEFNVLVATSIGEEGLDIPSVDLVVFYEAVPSAIRTIQRRGRTGRQEKGRVIVFVTKSTRDEIYSWSAHNKEKQMYRNLAVLRNKITCFLKKDEQSQKSQQRLENFIPEQKIKIFADHREKTSGVVKELIDLGAIVSLEALNNADYICSSKVGIELKTIPDFVQSIIDGRLLQQIKEMKRNFERPLIIVEGVEDIYAQRNVHPNAIRGMLATIAVSYGIPIINTKNPKDSAALIYLIAKREQEKSENNFSPHADRKPMTLKEQQEYVISAFPNIGSSLAKELLKQFKSVKNIVNADIDELKKIEKIGEKIAKGIKDVSESEYTEN